MSIEPEIKTILYATDLGKRTRPVFRHAISLAERYEAEIVMLHVMEPLSSAGEAMLDFYVSADKRQQMEHDGMTKVLDQMKERLHKFCEEESTACKTGTTPVSDVVVVHGHADVEIPKQAKAKNADMIVMGSTSGRFTAGGLFGSTCRSVVHASRVPVLIVPNT